MNTFQSSLKELMLERNINRVQLANALNISPSTIDGYFNKGYYPTIEIAIKLSKYFDCSLQFLLGLTDTNEKCANSNSKSFFEIYNQLLKENKVTNYKVLNDLNMSRNNYYRWKAGLIPKTQNLIELAKYLNVTVDY